MAVLGIPNLKPVKTRKEIMNQLFESLAAEEMAVACLIQAEAEKIQAFTGSDGTFPTQPTNKQINEFQSYVARILEAINTKQRNLIHTVKLSMELLEEQEERERDENGD